MSDDQTKQVAEYLDVPENDVKRMATRISAREVSLNAPMRTDEESTDVLSNMADTHENIAETVENMEMRRLGYDLLKKHLAALPERDREILVARRLTDPALTLEALAQKYKISRERVRQIEERAFDKLRNAILQDAGAK